LSFLGWVVVLVLVGLLVGGMARLALPGKDPMSLGETMMIGIAGTLISGVVTYFVFGAAPGLPLAVVFASVLVYLVRRSRGGSLTDPGRPPDRDRP
jgi:uncharacterized membrane protein YeaQ/YmgE (transglycosylase-associated protein family)